MATGDFAPGTDARTRNRALAVFLADTLNLSPAWTLTASGRYNDAITELRAAIALDPNYVTAYINRALAHNDKGDYNRALADYTVVIRLDPAPSHTIAGSLQTRPA